MEQRGEKEPGCWPCSQAPCAKAGASTRQHRPSPGEARGAKPWTLPCSAAGTLPTFALQILQGVTER